MVVKRKPGAAPDKVKHARPSIVGRKADSEAAPPQGDLFAPRPAP